MTNIKMPLAMKTTGGQGVSVVLFTTLSCFIPILAGVLVVCGQTFSRFMGALALRGLHRPADPVYSRQPSEATMPIHNTGRLRGTVCTCTERSTCGTKNCSCRAYQVYCNDKCHLGPSACKNKADRKRKRGHEPKDKGVKVNKRSEEPETKKEGKEEKDKKRKKTAKKRPEEQETKKAKRVKKENKKRTKKNAKKSPEEQETKNEEEKEEEM